MRCRAPTAAHTAALNRKCSERPRHLNCRIQSPDQSLGPKNLDPQSTTIQTTAKTPKGMITSMPASLNDFSMIVTLSDQEHSAAVSAAPQIRQHRQDHQTSPCHNIPHPRSSVGAATWEDDRFSVDPAQETI
jgi:hypothetical protein